MMRRGFWLGLGAVLGIAGYRRLVRLGRALTALPGRPAAGFASPGLVDKWPAGRGPFSVTAARELGAETASFVRDVRAGMAEYRDGGGGYLNRHAGD